MDYIEILKIVSHVVSFISIVVLVWGVALTVVQFFRNELRPQDKQEQSAQRQMIRAFLGTYILISLEILIAADIIDTIASPDTTEVILLAATVLIRTFVSYFLNREIKEVQEIKAGIES